MHLLQKPVHVFSYLCHICRTHYFTLEHSKDYQQVQFQFLDAVESLNPQNLTVITLPLSAVKPNPSLQWHDRDYLKGHMK